MGVNKELLYVIELLSKWKIYPTKTIRFVVMFDGSSNIHLGGELMEIHYTKLTVINGVEHAVYLFFNYVSKIRILYHVITAHKAIYNLFGHGIYHKPCSVFKSKSYYSCNSIIGLFSVNDTRMPGYFIVIHRNLCMRKSLLATVSYA